MNMRPQLDNESRAADVALRLDNVVRRYPGNITIGPVSLTAHQGEFISLLGPSGCGKTTLLRSIAGFETITSGAIQLRGKDVANLPAHRRNVGLVFQNYSLFPHLTAFQNVAFGLRLQKVSAKEISRRVSTALAVVGLSGVDDRRPSQLSGGQQQRVAIARSLVLEPQILLLDEPLSNLDLKLRIQMRQELRNLQRRLNTTFVYVTHDQTEALAMSDRIAVLSAGQVVQFGTPKDIYSRPRTRFVADFIGGANLVRAKVACVEPTPMACFSGGGLYPLEARAELVAGREYWTAIRPEDIQLTVSDDSHFSGKVLSSTYLGDRTEFEVELAGETVIRAAGRGVVSEGERVSLKLAPEATAVVVEE